MPLRGVCQRETGLRSCFTHAVQGRTETEVVKLIHFVIQVTVIGDDIHNTAAQKSYLRTIVVSLRTTLEDAGMGHILVKPIQ